MNGQNELMTVAPEVTSLKFCIFLSYVNNIQQKIPEANVLLQHRSSTTTTSALMQGIL